jgi:hypothetical protein
VKLSNKILFAATAAVLVWFGVGSVQAQNPASLSVVDQTAHVSIRAMAANLSSGNDQSYDRGEGMRIFQGLKPDVVMIQEFNYKKNSPEDIRSMIDEAFGPDFHYYRENEPSDQIPNGVISRFPILESGEWEDKEMPNRDFAWAKLDLPGDRELWVISVHLSASKAPKRKLEAEELRRRVEAIEAKIPPNDYVLLGGDFNIGARDDVVIETLKPWVFELNPPRDSKGKTETNMNGKRNYDWILHDADLAPLQVPTRFVADELETLVEGENLFTHGLVFDSSIFARLPLVAPILSSDSRAPQMQHLAVVKDYKIPVPVAVDCDSEITGFDCR